MSPSTTATFQTGCLYDDCGRFRPRDLLLGEKAHCAQADKIDTRHPSLGAASPQCSRWLNCEGLAITSPHYTHHPQATLQRAARGRAENICETICESPLTSPFQVIRLSPRLLRTCRYATGYDAPPSGNTFSLIRIIMRGINNKYTKKGRGGMPASTQWPMGSRSI